METLRFTRALFGLAPSPFLLGGVVQQHLENCREQYPKVVEEIEKSLYVDDLISGGPTIPAARQVKETSSDIFAQGGFTLHKWHSNARELDTVNIPTSDETSDTQETYAKRQLAAAETHPFTEKIIMQSHLATLRGGVAVTMTKVREGHWVQGYDD